MLRNLKRERFCQEILRNGGNATQAYSAIYGKTGHVAESAGSRMLNFVDVQGRLSELSQPKERKARLDAASLLDEMASVIADAKASQQHGVRVTAATLAAKIQGMLTDKLEIGPPGAFSTDLPPDEIARRMLNDAPLPDLLAGLDALKTALIRAASERAVPVN